MSCGKMYDCLGKFNVVNISNALQKQMFMVELANQSNSLKLLFIFSHCSIADNEKMMNESFVPWPY